MAIATPASPNGAHRRFDELGSARGSWPPTGAAEPGSDVVRIFNEEPDLLTGVDDRSASHLRRRAVARKLWVEEGPWDLDADEQRWHGWLGLLVIDGLLIRTVELHGRCCPELVGAGDVLRPWEPGEASVGHATSWTALHRSSVAILDERFAAIAGRWPSIMSALLARSVQRSRSLALQLAIVHVRHAEMRLRLLFWHLADRWGRVTPAGVHVPLCLTHEMLAQLTCMRRPTASSTLSSLARGGEIRRRRDGTWLLTGSPPASVDEP